jgi:hypothetical protein
MNGGTVEFSGKIAILTLIFTAEHTENAKASGNLARLETDEKTEKMSKKTYRISKILKTEVNQNPQKTMNIMKPIYSID